MKRIDIRLGAEHFQIPAALTLAAIGREYKAPLANIGGACKAPLALADIGRDCRAMYERPDHRANYDRIGRGFSPLVYRRRSGGQSR